MKPNKSNPIKREATLNSLHLGRTDELRDLASEYVVQCKSHHTSDEIMTFANNHCLDVFTNRLKSMSSQCTRAEYEHLSKYINLSNKTSRARQRIFLLTKLYDVQKNDDREISHINMRYNQKMESIKSSLNKQDEMTFSSYELAIKLAYARYRLLRKYAQQSRDLILVEAEKKYNQAKQQLIVKAQIKSMPEDDLLLESTLSYQPPTAIQISPVLLQRVEKINPTHGLCRPEEDAQILNNPDFEAKKLIFKDIFISEQEEAYKTYIEALKNHLKAYMQRIERAGEKYLKIREIKPILSTEIPTARASEMGVFKRDAKPTSSSQTKASIDFIMTNEI